MKKIMFYLQFVLLLVVAGCVGMGGQYGVKIDQSKVAEIKKGVTTKAEVEALLGAPQMVSMIGDGRRMMSYSYSDSSVHATATSYIPVVGMFTGGATGNTRTQTLQIMISKTGVVDDYEFSDNTKNIESSGGVFNPRVQTTESGAH